MDAFLPFTVATIVGVAGAASDGKVSSDCGAAVGAFVGGLKSLNSRLDIGLT